MERRPTWTDLVLAGAVALSVVVAGAVLASLPAGPATWSIEVPAADSSLHRWSVAAASTVDPLGVRLRPMTSRATALVEHAPELLLVVELGLLVEHLRLLHRVSDTLPARADAGSPSERPPPEAGRR